MAEGEGLGANYLGGAGRDKAGYCGTGDHRAIAQVYEGARRVETVAVTPMGPCCRNSGALFFQRRDFGG